ncbi:MAG: hypothetical protein LC737_00960, partial [Chloroflexi bacterium]|nr:hypothetical protein [Chloroflexota bacterium]
PKPFSAALRTWVMAGALGIAVVAPYLLWVWRNAQMGISSYAAEPGFAQWSALNFIQREFVTPDGRLQFPYPSAFYYAAAAVRGGALTPLVIPFAVWGAWDLWRRRAAAVLVVLLGWCAAIYLFIAGMPWQNLRFAFAFFPALAIIAAFGLTAVTWTPRRSLLARGIAQQITVLVMALVVIVQLTLGYRELDQFMTVVRNDLSVAQWLQQELPSDATVLTFSISETLMHETPFRVVELYFETPDTLANRLRGEHTYLLLDVHSVETQWAGRAPALNYAYLREHARLREMGARQKYTLYQIQSQ